MRPETPLSSRLTDVPIANGYESPRPQFLTNGDNINLNGSHANLDGDSRYRGHGEGNISGQVQGNDAQALQDDTSLTELGQQSDEEATKKKYGIRDRIGCFTWTWFTMTMATGGIANVLHTIPYRSEWLRVLGVIVFLFNIILFLFICSLISLRFRWNPGSFRSSFISPSECLFIPACVVSVGTILINMAQYGLPRTGPWFHTVMQVCFWGYASISFIASSGMYLIIWSTQEFPIHTMTPIWIFPAYPALLLAPLASNIISSLPDDASAERINSIAIAYGAVCVQGTGFMVSLMIYSAFIYRLMTQKLPRENRRPGMFVSVGPSGFTVSGLVNLGLVVNRIFPESYMGHSGGARLIFRIFSLMAGLWIYGLCIWFFLVSIGAHLQVMKPNDAEHHIHFDMTWYSFVFPNTALITATFAVGESLNSHAIRIIGTVLSGLLVCLWIFIFYMMIRALVFKKILWPGRLDGSEISWRKWISGGLAVTEEKTSRGSDNTNV